MDIRAISCPDPACRGAGEPILQPINHFRCRECGLVFDLKSWAEVTMKDLKGTDNETPE